MVNWHKGGCRALIAAVAVFAGMSGGAAAQSTAKTPAQGEVPLPALNGWRAHLVYETPDDGIWTVRSFQLFERYGCPEIVALDDAGRCTVLVSYSGKWTPWQTVHDGKWLGAVTRAHLDRRRAGPALFAGGARGRLYRILPRKSGGFDTLVALDLPGEEIHTLVAGDLCRARDGEELLVFTRSGAVFDVRVHDGGFRAVRIGTLPGRVRGALLLDGPEDARHASGDPWIATVSRARQVAMIRHAGDALMVRVIHEADMGFGRITRNPAHPGVLYVTRDDGVLMRLARRAGKDVAEGSAAWQAETIYAGPQGLRGVVAGRFHEDPAMESVAVFGYSRRVQLLHRPRKADAANARWDVETIFVDRAAGHDLIAVEVDGRNATREIVGSGYGGRTFLLSRPPGFGLDVAVDPDPEPVLSGAADGAAEGKSVRVAVAASATPVSKLTTLRYGGGFETKTFLYETLVTRDDAGRLAPGLAASWRYEDDGRSVVLRLAPGRRFHDGRPVDAASIAAHFRRWIGFEEHAWLGATRRIQRVIAVDDDTVRIEMDRPYAVIPELVATNPCAIIGPGAFGPGDTFAQPIGTGPFRFVSAAEDGTTFRYAPAGGARDGKDGTVPSLILQRLGHPMREDPVAALRGGAIDVVVDGWLTRVPRPAIGALKGDDRFTVTESPGSAVRFIAFNRTTCGEDVRGWVASTVDRAQLIDTVEGGYGVACRGWIAPTVEAWPKAEPDAAPNPPRPRLTAPLRILADAKFAEDAKLARSLVAQFAKRGVDATAVTPDRAGYRRAVAAGEYDLRLDRTWGVPYDPFLSLACRYGPADPAATSRAPDREIPTELATTVARLTGTVDPTERQTHYASIQSLVDRDHVVVPLYTTPRFGVVRRTAGTLAMSHDIYRFTLQLHR